MANKEIEAVVAMMFANSELESKPTLAERRAAYEGLGQAFPVSDDVRVTPLSVNGVSAEEIIADGADPDQVLLYFHGGGYALGGFLTHRTLVADLSRASGRRALLVDYRLAPEHRFPAPVEDATAAYCWLLDSGVSAANICLAGDSAGGGLTMATLLSLKSQNIALPAGALCISPWVDLQMTGASHIARADQDPMVKLPDLKEWVAMYLGDADPANPLASPIHGDLAGLPPLLIQVGTAETLLDDAFLLERAAKRAGIDVNLRVWEDMIHVWHHFAPVVADARRAIDEAGLFLKRCATPS